MYYGVVQNSLNQIPNTNAGIEATRKMDFVWGTGVFFDASRQYCDIVVPVTSYWEQDDTVYSGEASAIFYINKMLEPSFESKTLWDISEMLAEKLGMDPKEINPASQQERALATAVGASITDAATGETKPLLTITQEDIDAFGAPGTPQEGVIELAELKEAGIYKYPVKEGAVIPEPFAAFIADPEANPSAIPPSRPSASGRSAIRSRASARRPTSSRFCCGRPIPCGAPIRCRIPSPACAKPSHRSASCPPWTPRPVASRTATSSS